MAEDSMDNQKIAYTLGRGRASTSVLSGPEILIWTNGPGAASRGWSRSGYLDQEGLKVDPGPDLQSGAISISHACFSQYYSTGLRVWTRT